MNFKEYLKIDEGYNQVPSGKRVTDFFQKGGTAYRQIPGSYQKEAVKVVGFKDHEDKQDGYIIIQDSSGKETKVVWSSLWKKK